MNAEDIFNPKNRLDRLALKRLTENALGALRSFAVIISEVVLAITLAYLGGVQLGVLSLALSLGGFLLSSLNDGLVTVLKSNWQRKEPIHWLYVAIVSSVFTVLTFGLIYFNQWQMIVVQPVLQVLIVGKLVRLLLGNFTSGYSAEVQMNRLVRVPLATTLILTGGTIVLSAFAMNWPATVGISAIVIFHVLFHGFEQFRFFRQVSVFKPRSAHGKSVFKMSGNDFLQLLFIMSSFVPGMLLTLEFSDKGSVMALISAWFLMMGARKIIDVILAPFGREIKLARDRHHWGLITSILKKTLKGLSVVLLSGLIVSVWLAASMDELQFAAVALSFIYAINQVIISMTHMLGLSSLIQKQFAVGRLTFAPIFVTASFFFFDADVFLSIICAEMIVLGLALHQLSRVNPRLYIEFEFVKSSFEMFTKGEYGPREFFFVTKTLQPIVNQVGLTQKFLKVTLDPQASCTVEFVSDVVKKLRSGLRKSDLVIASNACEFLIWFPSVNIYKLETLQAKITQMLDTNDLRFHWFDVEDIEKFLAVSAPAKFREHVDIGNRVELLWYLQLETQKILGRDGGQWWVCQQNGEWVSTVKKGTMLEQKRLIRHSMRALHRKMLHQLDVCYDHILGRNIVLLAPLGQTYAVFVTADLTPQKINHLESLNNLLLRWGSRSFVQMSHVRKVQEVSPIVFYRAVDFLKTIGMRVGFDVEVVSRKKTVREKNMDSIVMKSSDGKGNYLLLKVSSRKKFPQWNYSKSKAA